MTSVTDDYYSARVARSDDLLWQVGKTVDGKVVGSEQLALIVEQIVSSLDLGPDDQVLDIGAGNGILTKMVAGHCASVTGFERNDALHEQAMKESKAWNVSYACQSLNNIDFNSHEFNKVFFYEVVQHFDYFEVSEFLEQVFSALPDNGAVFLGGVPSELKKWNFYSNDERRRSYLRALAAGSDVMGTWYHPEFFDVVADDLQLDCKILAQNTKLYTSSYRFDCLLKKTIS